MTSVIVFVLLSLIFCFIWGKSLWYGSEKSAVMRNSVFFLMSATKGDYGKIKSLLLSCLYYLGAILGIASFCFYYRLNFMELLTFNKEAVYLTVAGIFSAISITNIITGIYQEFILRKKIDFQKEVLSIPWIDGVMKLPKWLIPLSPGIAGFFEESFFRGAVLGILLYVFQVPFLVALVISTGLFIFQQTLQVKNIHQAVIIGSGCIAISIAGGILVLLTGSIIPAAIAHAAFVVFYF